MRHRVKKIKLSRDYDHKRALQKNLLKSFLKRGKIETTRPRALVTQRLVERVISRSRDGGLPARRYLYQLLQDQKWVNHLINSVFPQLKERNSGFTRLRRVRVRKGDGSLIYRLEFVKDVSLKRPEEEKDVGADKKKKKDKSNKENKK